MNATRLCCLAAFLILGGACGSDKEPSTEKTAGETIDLKAVVDEAGVDFARKQLAELDARLASDDPGSASSICSVIESDMPAIEKADPKLAEMLKQRCGRDVAVRSLARFVEKAEASYAADPTDTFSLECSSFSIYMKPVSAAGAGKDPAVAELQTRFAKVCPSKE